MIRPDFRDSVVTCVSRTVRLVWIAMGVAILSLGFVLMIARGRLEVEQVPLVIPVLYAAAITVALASILLRRFMEAKASVAPPRVAQNTDVPPSSEEERRFAAGAMASSQISIVTFAMSESVALFGFVLSFLSGEMTHYAALTALSFVLLLFVHAPTKDRIVRLGERAAGAH